MSPCEAWGAKGCGQPRYDEVHKAGLEEAGVQRKTARAPKRKKDLKGVQTERIKTVVETKTIRARAITLLAALLLALGSAFATLALPAQDAYADDDTVREAANGVMKFNWAIDGAEFSRGSCFLINDDHILTGYHCTFFSTDELNYYNYSGQDVQELRDRMSYSVTINRDVTVGATLVNCSEEQDWAVFKLDQKLNGYTPLTFRSSADVQAAEAVYSLGFPANSDLQVINTYTSDDVTIKSGTVSKSEGIYQGYTAEGFVINGHYIQSTCQISGGDSGGPMVDADGYVVGISLMSDTSYYYAAASDYILEALETLGIEYEIASEPDPEPDETVDPLSFTALDSAINDAENLDPEAYTEESYAAIAEPLEAAKGAQGLELAEEATQEERDELQSQIDEATTNLEEAIDALEPAPQGLPTWALICIIAGAVVVVAAIVLAVVLASRKKKKKAQAQEAEAPVSPTIFPQVHEPAQIPAPQPNTMQHAAPNPAQRVIQVPTSAISDDGYAATTIGAMADNNETTIQVASNAEGGILTRMSTNEKIHIDRAEFTIGRNRQQCDYCLEGNTSISRLHCRFKVHDGKTYLIDNKSGNGTYLNNTKVRPGDEQELKSGDIIMIADEKFKFTK